MKAMLFNEFGPPEVLHYEDRPDPEPGPDDLVIEVHAVSVNRVLDVDIRSGRVPHYGVNPPHIPGVDPSDVVVAIGDKVTDFAVGDRVLISKTATTCKGGYVSPTVKGRYGTVVDLLTSYNNGEVLVEAEKTDGRTLGQAIDPADLTKVEPEPEPLKVGDRVVRTGPHLTSLGTDYGDRECAVGWGGVVTEDDEDGDFSVRWDLSGRVSSITASSLRKVVDQ